jgi:hypothetical protein
MQHFAYNIFIAALAVKSFQAIFNLTYNITHDIQLQGHHSSLQRILVLNRPDNSEYGIQLLFMPFKQLWKVFGIFAGLAESEDEANGLIKQSCCSTCRILEQL